MTRIVIVLFSLLSLSSCFVADNIFVEDDTNPSADNLQLKSESAVKKYIQDDLSKDIPYQPYGFSNIKIIKPLAILELENLEKSSKANPSDTSLENSYLKKKEYVQSMRIERVIEIEHFFTIEKDSNEIQILELTYYLNDTFGIKSFEPKIICVIPTDYRVVLDYYFKEYTIFGAQTYSESRKLSLNFYRFFKDKLEQIDNIQAKSKFLKHTLEICRIVKLTGHFNQDFVAQTLIKNFMLTERLDITNYEALDFTELYETKNNDTGDVIGYYFFHKFSGTYKGALDTNVVLVEFSPYYEVDQIFQMDQPFETYIKQLE